MASRLSQPKQESGFTLIEALITIIVLGVLAAIATPSFISWLNAKKVNDVATQVESAIKETQATAIKRNQTCTLTLNTVTYALSSTPASCLPTGTRDLAKLGIKVGSSGSGNDSGVQVSTANLTNGTPPQIKFHAKGTTEFSGPGTTGLFVVYQASGTAPKRCIAIANGVGIIRAGLYTGTTPNNPIDTGNCETRSTT